MMRWLLLVLALGVIGGAGYLHGRHVDRWGGSHVLQQAVERINKIGMIIGDWEGKANEINARHLEVGEIAGYASRTYVHKKTHDQVGILLICGRPGPISVHTPDICYQGLGYVMGERVSQFVPIPGLEKSPEFWAARFTKDPGPNPLNILWTWSTGGRWTAPDHPRVTFYRSPYLYKLYIIRGVQAHNAALVDDATRHFLSDFMPELQKHLLEIPLSDQHGK